jgi:hypothetical protein
MSGNGVNRPGAATDGFLERGLGITSGLPTIRQVTSRFRGVECHGDFSSIEDNPSSFPYWEETGTFPAGTAPSDPWNFAFSLFRGVQRTRCDSHAEALRDRDYLGMGTTFKPSFDSRTSCSLYSE